jgi:DNA-binding response OmpR family regulator
MPLPAQPSALVVDDDDSIRLSTAMLLSVMGVTPELAGSGHTALQLMHDRHYDLAIVDLGLPDIEGSDLIAKFHALAPDMLIVIMSGDNHRINRVRHLADHCVEKPMSAHALRSAIDKLLLAHQEMPL